MNILADDRIAQMSLKINELFEDGCLESLARSTGFIERSSSRLSGSAFVMLNVLEGRVGPDWSLQDCCDRLRSCYGIQLSKQSLDERYNTFSVSFLKTVYENFVQALTERQSVSNLRCFFRK